MSKRTLLIVEDQMVTAEVHKMSFMFAVQELNRDFKDLGLQDEIQVTLKTAKTAHEALTILKETSIDVMTVDLALSASETNHDDKTRRIMGDPGGIQLLQEVSTFEDMPLTVIISGERLETYATEAFTKYRVLQYFLKTDSTDPIVSAIKALLGYLETRAQSQPELARKMFQVVDQYAKLGRIPLDLLPPIPSLQ